MLGPLGCGSSVVVGDGDPDGPQGPGPSSQSYACHAAEGDARPMLAARLDDGLHFAYRDRSAREVFTFDVPEQGYVADARLLARGELVAAYVLVSPLGGTEAFEPYGELVVVDLEGVQRAYERFDFAYEGWGSDMALVGNEAGLFALTSLEVKTSLGVVVDGAEVRTFSDKLAARSDPDPAGRLVALDYEAPSSVAFHFLDLHAGQASPSQYLSGDHASSAAVLGHGIAYLDRDPARWIFEDADGTITGPVDVQLEPVSHASPGWQRDGGWLLFGLGGASPELERYLALHVGTRRSRGFSLTPPEPWQLPGDHWNTPAIDASGRVVVPLSDGSRFQLFATANGADWEAIGRPITEDGYAPKLVTAGGAVVFAGVGSDAPVAEGALPAYADQLVGPQGGEGIELVRHDALGGLDNPSSGEDALSPDGSCLAYYRNGSLHVIETDSYALSDLGLVATGQHAETVWIASPNDAD